MCADRLSNSAMPENDQLKKNQPEQPENALDKRRASGPRGIAVRDSLPGLSIHL